MATFNTNGTEILIDQTSIPTLTGTVKKKVLGGPPYTGTTVHVGTTTDCTNASVTLKRGIKNADWPKRRAAGQIVISPYYLKKGLFEGSTFSVNRTSPDVYRYDYEINGVGVPATVVSSVFAKTFISSALADSHESQARTAAHSNVGKAAFEMGVFLLEGKESAKMLMDRYNKLVRVVTRTVYQAKQRSKRPGDWLQEFANLWLRQRYGVEPLLKDLESLINLDKPNPKIREISLGRSVPTESSASFTSAYSTSNALCWTDFRVSGFEKQITSCKVGVFADYAVHNPLWWLCRQLGLSAPVSIVYELTRLSFVFDWFINLGEYIMSYEMQAGIIVTDSWATIRTHYELDLTMLYSYGNAADLVADQYAGPIGKFKLFEMSRIRTAITPPLIPTIRVKLDALKILDSLALLTQAIKK